jgi:hypothetical protein
MSKNNDPPRAGDFGRVLAVGDAYIYAVGDGHLGVLAPKSVTLERKLRAIPDVTVCDDLDQQTNAVLEPIRLIEVRAVLQDHSIARRSRPAGPTVALRRGGVW